MTPEKALKAKKVKSKEIPAKKAKSAVKKPRAHSAVKIDTAVLQKPSNVDNVLQSAPDQKIIVEKLGSRYVFATGRRKTSVANVRLFEGKGENIVNKKNYKTYFQFVFHQEEIIQPFNLTGLEGKYYFTASISGGGSHSQAGALRHGISSALAVISPDYRKVLKKNGLLTRDDRKKERKKPGLKRARRAPQWAKR